LLFSSSADREEFGVADSTLTGAHPIVSDAISSSTANCIVRLMPSRYQYVPLTYVPLAEGEIPVRILAISAHPDDVELLCAGTLAHYATQGAEVTVAVLTNGELGSRTLSRAETARVRQAEAERAARVLGANLLWLGQQDGFLFDNSETRLLVIDALRQAQPDVVFAHHPDDYHPDHRAAGQLTNAARLLSREPALETRYSPTRRVPALFFMDTFMTEGSARPDLWVDVTVTMPCKEAMLAEHISQNDARRARTGSDFLALMRTQASLRGGQVDVRYAEAFRVARTYPPTSITDLTPPDSNMTLPVRSVSSRA